MIFFLSYKNSALEKYMSIKLSKKLFRFIFIGGLSTVSYIILVSVFVSLAKIQPSIASILAYCFSLPLSFVGHRFHTFNSNGIIWEEILKFIIIHVISLGIVFFTMHIFFTLLSYSYWVGSVSGAVLVPLFNFLFFNCWVFKHRKEIK